MATVTAQFLVGTSHPYHDGICPTHQILLFENSRPSLQLIPMEPSLGETSTALWIPTVDDMIHDAMLMISTCIFGDEKITNELATFFPDGLKRLDSMLNIPEPSRKNLYKACQNSTSAQNAKLVLTVLNDSSLLRQHTGLGLYSIRTELCVSTSANSLQ